MNALRRLFRHAKPSDIIIALLAVTILLAWALGVGQ